MRGSSASGPPANLQQPDPRRSRLGDVEEEAGNASPRRLVSRSVQHGDFHDRERISVSAAAENLNAFGTDNFLRQSRARRSDRSSVTLDVKLQRQAPEPASSSQEMPRRRVTSEAPNLDLDLDLGLTDYAQRRFTWYAVLCTLSLGLTSGLAIAVWSSVGAGRQVFDFLLKLEHLAWIPLSSGSALLVLLYLVDFFCPPNPDLAFVLWSSDPGFGIAILATALFMLVVALVLSAGTVPELPVIATFALGPLLLVQIRLIFCMRSIEPSKIRAVMEHGTAKQKLQLLNVVNMREFDTRVFYKATLFAFGTSSSMCLGLWVCWATFDHGWEELELKRAHHTIDKLTSVMWITPLIGAFWNFGLGLLMLLRIMTAGAYFAADPQNNLLLAKTIAPMVMMMQGELGEDTTMRSQASLLVHCELSPSAKNCIDQLEAYYKDRHKKSQVQMLRLMKACMCLLAFLLGLMYIGLQILGNISAEDSYISSLIFALLAGLGLAFAVFMCTALRRLVSLFRGWVSELPVFTLGASILRSDWFRALGLIVIAPLVPVVFFLSAVNQCLRRQRGTYQYEATQRSRPPSEFQTILRTVASFAEHGISDIGSDTMLLTPRVDGLRAIVQSWHLLSITSKTNILCFFYCCYVFAPVFLNFFLAWSIEQLKSWSFFTIYISTFCIGLGIFLLPPVPGVTVYLFGGLLLSPTCPFGFWIGSAMNVALCWILKLVACAVQQKCIGGLLGQSIRIRHFVGVHRTSIRCLEAVLRKPGLQAGKISILCSGPDWPTSVLAGIMGLSILQCELGTIPIIAFIIPCAMSGSLYIKATENQYWENVANIMILVSVVVCMVMWAIGAWAIQDELERGGEALLKPLAEHVELEWMDYRASEIDKYCNMTWHRVPSCLRTLYGGSAFVHALVIHSLFWSPHTFVSGFLVTDHKHMHRVDILGPNGLVTHEGVFLILVYLVTWMPFFWFRVWRGHAVRAPSAKRAAELDQAEAEWKRVFLEKTRTEPESTMPARAETEGAEPRDAAQEPALKAEQDRKHRNDEVACSPYNMNAGESVRAFAIGKSSLVEELQDQVDAPKGHLVEAARSIDSGERVAVQTEVLARQQSYVQAEQDSSDSSQSRPGTMSVFAQVTLPTPPVDMVLPDPDEEEEEGEHNAVVSPLLALPIHLRREKKLPTRRLDCENRLQVETLTLEEEEGQTANIEQLTSTVDNLKEEVGELRERLKDLEELPAQLLDMRADLEDKLLDMSPGAEPTSPLTPSSSSMSPSYRFASGDYVRVSGLQQTPSLNGACGRLLQWYPDAGRWVVRIEGCHESRLLKATNLAPLAPSAWQSSPNRPEIPPLSLRSASLVTGTADASA